MAQVVVEMTSDEAKLWRGMKKVEAQQKKMETGFQKVGRAGKKAGREIKDQWDKTGKGLKRGKLDDYAAGFKAIGVSAAAAAGVVLKAFRDMNQAADEAAERARQAEKGMTLLGQLAGGDPAKMKRLTGMTRELYREGGAENLDEAARTIFSLASADALKMRKLYAQMYGVIEAPGALAKGAATLQTAVGIEETGSFRAIIGKALKASQFSPATGEQILEATAGAGGPARMLGVTDEAMLAATALLAKGAGSAEKGGTQLEALLASLVKQEGFTGLGLAASIEKLGAMKLSDAEMMKFLGRKEALSGFSVLQANMPKLQEIVGEVQKAEAEDFLGQTIAMREADPEIVAARKARIARAHKELAEGKRGAQRNLAVAVIERKITEIEEGGEHDVIKQVQRWGWGLRKALLPSEDIIQHWGTPAEQQEFKTVRYAVEHDLPMNEAAEKMQEAAKELTRAGKIIADARERFPGVRLLIGPGEDR